MRAWSLATVLVTGACRSPGASPGKPGDDAGALDLVAAATPERDLNGCLLDPKWKCQLEAGRAPPDAQRIGRGFEYDLLTGKLWTPTSRYTTQDPTIDIPDPAMDIYKLSCQGGKVAQGQLLGLPGHLNWKVVTYQGTATWDSYSHDALGLQDEDVCLRLRTREQAGATRSSPGGAIICEFAAYETIDRFHTSWWQSLREAARSGNGESVFGQREAVVVGLFGLDCEHEAYSELHPVYGLLLHEGGSSADDRWVLFARNSGNEGHCSRYQHFVRFKDAAGRDRNRMILSIPWLAGASGAQILDSTEFGHATSAPSSVAIIVNGAGEGADKGIHVVVELPEPEARDCVEGEVHIRWQGVAAQATVSTLAADAGDADRGTEAAACERRLALVASLIERRVPDPSTLQALGFARAVVQPMVANRIAHQVLAAGAPEAGRQDPVSYQQEDQVKVQRDRANEAAVKNSFGGMPWEQIIGLVNAALEGR